MATVETVLEDNPQSLHSERLQLRENSAIFL